MFKKILIGFVLLIGAVLVAAALRSPDYRVERSISVEAPAQAVFEQFNSHAKFNVFNPWMKMDPSAKVTLTGPESGVGAVCTWEGDKTGAGSSTIIESKPNELIKLRMDWKRPMEGVSTVEYTIKPEGAKTKVTWAMYGTNNFVGKLVSLFMDCEKMCGPEFEKGLADMAKIVAPVQK